MGRVARGRELCDISRIDMRYLGCLNFVQNLMISFSRKSHLVLIDTSRIAWKESEFSHVGI